MKMLDDSEVANLRKRLKEYKQDPILLRPDERTEAVQFFTLSEQIDVIDETVTSPNSPSQKAVNNIEHSKNRISTTTLNTGHTRPNGWKLKKKNKLINHLLSASDAVIVEIKELLSENEKLEAYNTELEDLLDNPISAAKH
ncbi:ligase [Acrasis kona]|uniref:Ligase n=1 Tax=Acrasis kona TaxID=1008807 RepID=A0AAW2ZIA6_9EUKA